MNHNKSHDLEYISYMREYTWKLHKMSTSMISTILLENRYIYAFVSHRLQIMERMRVQANLLPTQPTPPMCSSRQPAIATSKEISKAATQGDKCHLMIQQVLLQLTINLYQTILSQLLLVASQVSPFQQAQHLAILCTVTRCQ